MQQLSSLLLGVGITEDIIQLDTKNPVSSVSFERALRLLDSRCVGNQRIFCTDRVGDRSFED